MNHDEDHALDFYSLADREEQQPGQASPPRPPLRKSKKKRKKGTSYGEVLFDDTPGEGFSLAHNRIISPLPPEAPPPPVEEYDGVNLNEHDFPPDDIAIDDETMGLPAPSLVDLDDYNEDEVVARRSTADSFRPPPLPVSESPRPAFAKPSVLLSPSTRPRTSHGSPNSHRSSVEQPYNASIAPVPARTRRESIPAQPPNRQHFVEPAAPPHMPQAHFYGLPDFGLESGQKKSSLQQKQQQQSGGKIAGSDGYCCCFDSLADAGDAASAAKAKDALLVGSEGALEILRVLPNKVEVVGRLEGLRGSVIGAKILPHVAVHDALQHLRPLVGLIVHGPMDEAGRSLNEYGENRRRSSVSRPLRYQTTVEIYSLQTQEHISTLFRSPPLTVPQPTIGHVSTIPESADDLCISAQGKYITVSSGKSGEVFVFTNLANLAVEEPQFRCIGKFWTSIQTPLEKSSSRPPSSSDPSTTADDPQGQIHTALLSLGQRWLAIAPPPTASHVSIQGMPHLPENNANPPGIASTGASQQPPITCELSGVDAEDAWSRLTRQAAQGVVKYSQKGMDLGWQGWKELTSPTTQSAQSHGRTASNERDGIFPPTKAPPDDPQRLYKEPALISIIDLDALLEAESLKSKYPPGPLASFALPDGCNFLSFSTSGLRLLTVSRKGEISTIWDLSRACYGKMRLQESPTGNDNPMNGPTVKQIHRVARSSPSVVVDCAWSQDDDSLAMLTTHGTVHLHEIPVRLGRTRKRRDAGPTVAIEKAEATVSVSQGLSPPSSNVGFLGSIRSSWQQMSTQVNKTKSSTSTFGIPTTFAGFRQATTSVGQAGGRVIAKGLSQGLSAAKGGASDYWHSEDNKIRHVELQDAGPRALKWIKRQSDLYLAVACGGKAHLHPVHRTHRRKGDVLVSGLKHDKYGKKHFTLPSIRTRASLEAVNGAMLPPHAKGPHGFWSLRNAVPASDTGMRKYAAQPSLAQTNEVETNPPYCPFHIDARVDIFAFDTNDDGNTYFTVVDAAADRNAMLTFRRRGHGFAKQPAWLFGEALPTSVRMDTHDDDLNDYLQHQRHRGEWEVDSEGGELAEQMRSVLTVHSVTAAEGEEEIRIRTHRAPPVEVGNGEEGEEEFDTLQDGEEA